MRLVTPAHLILVSVAAIWGFAFVAQSSGMDYLGPHSFNAARFILAAVSLLPVWWILKKHQVPQGKTLIIGGLIAGTVMFAGFSFQQIGLLHTTAGNAGFITGMYIVLVPIFGVLLGQSTNLQTWSGVLLAVLGLFSLSVEPDLSINRGDLMELIGAFFWTAHVLTIGILSRKVDAIALSIMQFVVAAVWASIAMFMFETPELADFQDGWLPLLYAGIASSGIACTLQIIGQKKIAPTTAALILSTEAVFAVIGGWFFLGEVIGSKELLGCALMLTGMMVSQWPTKKKENLVVST